MKLEAYPSSPIAPGDTVLGTRNGEQYNLTGLTEVVAPNIEIIDISALQLKTQLDDGISLLPSPGSDNYYDVSKIIFEYEKGTIAFTQSAILSTTGDFTCYLGSDFFTAGGDFNIAIATASSFGQEGGKLVQNIIQPNTPLILQSIANLVSGNGTLRVIVYYWTRTFGA